MKIPVVSSCKSHELYVGYIYKYLFITKYIRAKYSQLKVPGFQRFQGSKGSRVSEVPGFQRFQRFQKFQGSRGSRVLEVPGFQRFQGSRGSRVLEVSRF